ncbi:hypothetical protein JOC48_001748 [Aquibacillus albus]|uniref:Uncharacterized protein n=1 Tax=Aquibacillus albus TaxID=1168171 RepID=A0ABS2MZF2_9BACI|nr:hypothetical protein [Aquibacillus albus]
METADYIEELNKAVKKYRTEYGKKASKIKEG